MNVRGGRYMSVGPGRTQHSGHVEIEITNGHPKTVGQMALVLVERSGQAMGVGESSVE